MADDKHPTSLELGIYSQERVTPRITTVEVIAILLSVLWLAGVLWFFFGTDLSSAAGLGGSPLEITMLMLAIFMPIALIWVAASAAKTARIMREESARLQSAIDAMRAAYVAQQQRHAVEMKPAVIAKLTELNNEVTKGDGPTPRLVAEAMVRMLSPLVPHMAEELWSKLGGEGSVVWAEFPEADPTLLVDDQVELPVQVKGKVRGRIMVAPDADEETVLAAAVADENVAAHIGDAEIRKVIYVPGRMINIIA